MEQTLTQFTINNDRVGAIKVHLTADTHITLTHEEKWDLHDLLASSFMKIVNGRFKCHPETRKEWDEEKAALIGCFPHNTPIYVEEYANPYNSERPGITVTTPIGRIKMHWRKRVIQIDWTESKCPILSVHLFPSEEVTKDFQMIHAYGYKKATEYIGTIIKSA